MDRKTGKLADHRILIVGASSGVGAATAIAGARAGACLTIAARRLDRLAAVAEECADRALPLTCDVRNPADCQKVVEEAVAKHGGLDTVIYAAGVSDLALVIATSADEWHRILETNVVGPALIFAAAAPHLKASQGSMVVISSISVLRPKPGLVPYAASKGALHKLIEGLRSENPDIAFTVVTIGPTAGGEFSRDFDSRLAATLKEQWQQQGFLAPGLMTMEDVACRIVECLSAPMRIEDLVLLPRP